jgi:hypothetical protein
MVVLTDKERRQCPCTHGEVECEIRAEGTAAEEGVEGGQ